MPQGEGFMAAQDFAMLLVTIGCIAKKHRLNLNLNEPNTIVYTLKVSEYL